KRTYQIKAVSAGKGEYELEITDADADLSFKTKTFTVKRGERVALKAWFERKEAVAVKPSPDDAWIKEVAALPADKQVAAVAARLKERNPGFVGPVPHKPDGDVVPHLYLSAEEVVDLSPLRALGGLRRLDCIGSRSRKGQLTDLSPLRGLPLSELCCH